MVLKLTELSEMHIYNNIVLLFALILKLSAEIYGIELRTHKLHVTCITNLYLEMV